MATILLSAAGAAAGSAIGGTVAGLSTAVVGRAVGATLGRVIDQRLLGNGSRSVETGRVDRFRLTNSGEGEAISQLHGRMRLAGQAIWASQFLETVSTQTEGGGKGAPTGPKTTTTSYSYSISLALALCEGQITRVARIWANGEEIPVSSVTMRVYPGSAHQLPDPLIEAIEGAGTVPAYRGTAYVVFENLELERFGNRVPHFTFEVARPDQPGAENDMTRAIEAVAMMPGTGEYALATTPVYFNNGPGSAWSANINTPAAEPDFTVALDALGRELPKARAVSLIVSWFGGDLRCQHCKIRPKVEQTEFDSDAMPWRVTGLSRGGAQTIAQIDGKPIYGGTPTDQSVIESIQAMKTEGQSVMFYPFILMDQLPGSGLPDPYGGAEQANLPWRGRITLDIAPGQAGTNDGTAGAAAQVAAFYGTAQAADFTISGGEVIYNGPNEWSFSRFILHNAALCVAAGGVGSFCIGSEMRGMTQIRGADNSFPFVDKLMELTVQVRALLGHGTLIGYAADWSEYFGYTPQDGSGDRFFHLDPIWAHPDIDFVGIDNYMPLSDWRDGEGHLDADAGAIYDLDYLRGNIEGGEGYDWYYASDADAETQTRTPITDGAYGEPWIWRYKDMRNWWLNHHHDRVGGLRSPTASPWVPQSKPIWFTEYGCAAVNRGTNQPNKFIDPKSSESKLPKFSNGQRDDLIQMQYLRAMTSFYDEVANNPISGIYGGPMVDMSRAFVWAWDARPFPYFPNNTDHWSDGENYLRGHWITGRVSARPLSNVVAEMCQAAGLDHYDVSKLYGYVRGYTVTTVSSARAALQPLMLRFGFDAVERDGVLHFIMRDGQQPVTLDTDWLARSGELDGLTEQERDPDLELSGRVRVQFVQADGDFEARAEEAVRPEDATHGVAMSEVPMSLTRGEGRQTAERWLSEARVARDKLRFALPPSGFGLGAGDVVRLSDEDDIRYRIDRIEQGPHQIAEAVRIEPSVYTPGDVVEDALRIKPVVAPGPVHPLFLDLPLMRGTEAPHAPHLALTASVWPGSSAVYRSGTDSNYALNAIIGARSFVGRTQTALSHAPHGVRDRGAALRVELISGHLSSAENDALLAGANLAAIGDGTPGNWELFQFADATLVGENTYELSNRLRGQLGTDALMPTSWPAGSWLVLLDGALRQIDTGAHLRQVTQHFRIGPAQVGYDHPSYVHVAEAFDGNGLRPYAPVHLSAKVAAGGDLAIGWVRRTRIEGDNWEGEVPLGEDTERYLVQLSQGGTLIRSVETTVPSWTYPAALQSVDGLSGVLDISVAQVSARYGPGLAATTTVTLP